MNNSTTNIRTIYISISITKTSIAQQFLTNKLRTIVSDKLSYSVNNLVKVFIVAITKKTKVASNNPV